MSHIKCPVHDTATDYFHGVEPDENWQWMATALLQRINVGKADEDGIIHLDVLVTVTPGGYHWISSHDVIRAGISHRFPPDEVIAIGPSQAQASDEPDDNLYEVLAYVDDRRAYWIRPLRVPDDARDLG